MGDVLPYRPPQMREETTAWLGMVIVLFSWAMMFAALLFAYGFVRARMSAWPPEGVPPLPVLWPLANTVVLALSSALLQWGTVEVQRGNVHRLGPRLLGTVLLGAVFLGSQAFLWRSLASAGLHLDTGGPYASVFYGLTILHAVHVLVGLLGLGLVCQRAFAGRYQAARFLPVRLWGMYWHFMGGVWALMFVSVFVV